MNVKTLLGQLRLLAIMEGISYLLFAVTMPLKYMMDMGMPNKIVGIIHGVLFLAYCLWVVVYANSVKWTFANTFWSLLASILPFGTFVADAKIFSKEKEATSGSRQ